MQLYFLLNQISLALLKKVIFYIEYDKKLALIFCFLRWSWLLNNFPFSSWLLQRIDIVYSIAVWTCMGIIMICLFWSFCSYPVLYHFNDILQVIDRFPSIILMREVFPFDQEMGLACNYFLKITFHNGLVDYLFGYLDVKIWWSFGHCNEVRDRYF